MIWRKPKSTVRQPAKGCYKDWKEKIAKKCFYQCVYCAIHESSFGGIRNFHIEHYRPKSKFPQLTDNINNLFYACAICNVFKGNDWPNEPCPKHSNFSYPNPSETDYNKLFNVDNNAYEIAGRYQASKYLVERLFLNRPQLILIRRKFSVNLEVDKHNEFCNKITRQKPKSPKIMRYLLEYIVLLKDTYYLLNQLYKLRPYASGDITRRVK